jgi:glycyl-tRNA synthetase
MATDMQTLVTFAKTKGFVYQGSEIYGGLANSWDYGPLGILLKENIKNLWMKTFVQKRKDMVLLDAAIMMNPNVWVASGHVGSFSDPLMECKDCHTRHRADKLIEEKEWCSLPDAKWIIIKRFQKAITDLHGHVEWSLKNLKEEGYTEVNKLTPLEIEYVQEKVNEHKDILSASSDLIEYTKWLIDLDLEKFAEYIVKSTYSCPNCGSRNWADLQKFNLMLSTHQGTTEDASALVYLRPETAQGIFVNFPNIARSSRKKIPFGVAQAGKAFRNEITPKNFIFRTREFEQIEIEYFCKPGTDAELFQEWLENETIFFTEVLGFKADKVRFVEIPKEGLPHYSKRAGDFEYLFPFGWGEISTLANRTDYDLKAHMAESKQDLSYFDPFDNSKYIPYVIEPSIGLSRLTLAAMCDAYDEVPGEEGTSKTVMRFAPAVAPIKVGIYPLVKKFAPQAGELFAKLSNEFMCDYDEAGTIGKRYQRSEEMGIPYAIAVEPENYDQGQVTVRDRDTGTQEIVKIDELVTWLKKKGC